MRASDTTSESKANKTGVGPMRRYCIGAMLLDQDAALKGVELLFELLEAALAVQALEDVEVGRFHRQRAGVLDDALDALGAFAAIADQRGGIGNQIVDIDLLFERGDLVQVGG